MTKCEELKKLCVEDFEGARRLVREEGTKCFTADPSTLDSVLWDAIRGGRLDVIEWYYETFDGDECVWTADAYCKLVVVAFRDATADTLERCEATADYVFEKYCLTAQSLDDPLVSAQLSYRIHTAALGLNWMVRKIGAAAVYGILDVIELKFARKALDDIRHVPQLQVIADYLRMSIAARETRANRTKSKSVDRKQALMIALQNAISLQYDLPVDWTYKQVCELVAQCDSFGRN